MSLSELNEDAVLLAKECERLREGSGALVDAAERIFSGVGSMGVMLELMRLQRACLPTTHTFPAKWARGKAGGGRGGVAGKGGSGTATGGKENVDRRRSLAPKTPRKSMSGAPTPKAPGTVSKRRAFAREEFRDKLPRQYRSDEAMEELLDLRRFLRDRTPEGGATLAEVREYMGGKLPLMKVSQRLEVLTRLGYAQRKSEKGAMRYSVQMRKKRK